MYRQSEKMLNTNITSTDTHNIVNFGQLTAEIGWRRSMEVNQTLHDVWPSPWASTLCTALEQCASAKLQRSAEGATYIRQGGHHIGHRRTFKFVLIRYDQTTSRSLQLSMSYMKQNISAAENIAPVSCSYEWPTSYIMFSQIDN